MSRVFVCVSRAHGWILPGMLVATKVKVVALDVETDRDGMEAKVPPFCAYFCLCR